MNILVLNGSPKGKNSITYQTALYLQGKNQEHSYKVLHVGQRIKGLEKDFSEARQLLEEADLILFSYPVYTFIAPSQLHRFIELIKESGAKLDGKYATQITTSKHFYDVTAHRYIQDNCGDLGLKYIRGLSADMEDLLKDAGQKEAVSFFSYVLWCVKNDYYEPIPTVKASEVNSYELCSVPAHCRKKIKKEGLEKPVVIVTDCRPEDLALKGMIRRFQNRLPLETKVVNIREYPMKGGCLGCFHCAVSGKCIYKDGFDAYLREEIQTGLAIVYAFSISDHSMGARFKMYDDRQFCNGHRTVTMGMPMGYLIHGCYSKEENLRMILEGRAEVGGNYLAGIACDESEPEKHVDELAKKLTYAIVNKMRQPQNFYGVGGMKIFRDLIYQMQGMMKADHKFYKEHGQYDFPQKKKGMILAMYLVGALMSSPKVQKKMSGKMTEGMLMPYQMILKKK